MGGTIHRINNAKSTWHNFHDGLKKAMKRRSPIVYHQKSMKKGEAYTLDPGYSEFGYSRILLIVNA